MSKEMYTQETYFSDVNKIMYSLYYRALTQQQHGDGTNSAASFLYAKERIANSVLKNFGIVNSPYMEVLLKLDALPAAPFGTGGTELLTEKYGYNKTDYIVKIANELKLSDDVVSAFDDRESGSLQRNVLKAVNAVLEKSNGPTSESEQAIISDISTNSLRTPRGSINVGVSRKLLEDCTSITPSASSLKKIAGQKEDMAEAIEKAKSKGFKGDMVLYLLGSKETDLGFKGL